MKSSRGFRAASIALIALLGAILYLAGYQTVRWVKTGHYDIVTVSDGGRTLRVLDILPSIMPLGDWPLWWVLLVPATVLALQCRAMAREARKIRRKEDVFRGKETQYYRRRGH